MKIITGLFLLIFMCVNIPFTEARTVDEDFNLQLQAIAKYLQQQLPVSTFLLDKEEIKSVITGGIDWIIASQESSGHFEYEYLPFEGEYSNGDNIVRQAGTLYALSEFYLAQSKKDKAVSSAIESSLKYFAGLTEKADDRGSCIRSSRESRNCQLGSTALVLLGVLSYVEAEPSQKEYYDSIITDYADFLLASRLSERGFSENYNFGVGFKDKESPFFNGEVLLALARYYQYEARKEVKTTIDEVFSYLKEQEYDANLYLWIMAALKDMQKLWPSTEYVKYAEDFTDWRVARNIMYRQTTRNYCPYTEGLASAYSVLKGNILPEKELVLNNELNYWLRKNSWLQIGTENPYRVTYGEDGVSLNKIVDTRKAWGGFLTGASELTQRIDFTQHCVSSYLQKFVDIDGGQL